MSRKKKNLDLKRRLREADPTERADLIDGLPYEVGFGKPPKDTRFSSERQPARRGRGEGSENLDTILREELAATIVVTENGRRRRRSKLRVAAAQSINKAVRGEERSWALVLGQLRRIEPAQPSDSSKPPLIDQRDVETLERIAQTFDGSATATDPLDKGGSA
jgi:hypothetical protein